MVIGNVKLMHECSKNLVVEIERVKKDKETEGEGKKSEHEKKYRGNEKEVQKA